MQFLTHFKVNSQLNLFILINYKINKFIRILYIDNCCFKIYLSN